MKLIVGLGNPGRRYIWTRHNIGFMAVDNYARAMDAEPFTEKFSGLFWRGDITWETGAETVAILKPQTFMNESGKSVSKAVKKFSLDPLDMLVVHDDIDLEQGEVRAKSGGGTGGHNGLESIVELLGGEKDFLRLRIGVGRPPPGMDPAEWVLKAYRPEERPEVKDAIDRAALAIETIIIDGIKSAMNRFNKKK